jgi:Ca2+-binding EF-hand superfamily protein
MNFYDFKDFLLYRKYVDNVFAKWDLDGSNVLSRQELKYWLRDEQQNKPLIKKSIRESFFEMIANADSNGDGKLDRWELYEYCVGSYIPDSQL